MSLVTSATTKKTNEGGVWVRRRNGESALRFEREKKNKREKQKRGEGRSSEPPVDGGQPAVEGESGDQSPLDRRCEMSQLRQVLLLACALAAAGPARAVRRVPETWTSGDADADDAGPTYQVTEFYRVSVPSRTSPTWLNRVCLGLTWLLWVGTGATEVCLVNGLRTNSIKWKDQIMGACY